MNVIIIGASGHGKVSLDSLLSSKLHNIKGFIDDNPKLKGTMFCNLPVLGNLSFLKSDVNSKENAIFIGIGDNEVRSKIFTELRSDFVVVNAIHSNSIITKFLEIGKGVLIVGGVVINSGTKIGDGVIINTGATVDHDNIIGKFAHIAPGVHLAGNVSIGNHSLVGIGASVIQNISIGNKCVIGAGSVVIDDVPDNCVAYGVPAKIKKKG